MNPDLIKNQVPANNGSLLPASSYHLTAHHLRFKLKVDTPIELDQHQGAALRGMLFNALRGPNHNPALGFCTQRHLTTCAECALVAACPVAGLVSTLDPQSERGRDLPRPYAIVPPHVVQTRYEPGQIFNFGLTLFGDALALFPYVVMALHQAGPGGLGKRLPRPEQKFPGDNGHGSNERRSNNGQCFSGQRFSGQRFSGQRFSGQRFSGQRFSGQRGRFTVQSAEAINLLTGEVQDILPPGSTMVQQPALPVTHAQIIEMSRYWLAARADREQEQLDLTLTFITPTRLVAQKHLQKTPHFAALFHRLLERLFTLEREFGGSTEPVAVRPDKNSLLALADQVELVNDRTGWEEVWSYSARQGKKTPIGGLMGPATYQAPRRIWETLLPYLLWGQVIHVGKNAVKGDGIIAVSR